MLVLINHCLFDISFFGRHIHMFYFGTLFWISGDISSEFQSQRGFCLQNVEVNRMYIPWNPPLVLHIANLLMVSIVEQQFKPI